MALIHHTKDFQSRALAISFLVVLSVIMGQHYCKAQSNADSLRDLTPQAIFDKANIQIELKHYKQALSMYEVIDAKDLGSGPLYLNMGVAWTRLDSLGLAKYYFIKASDFPSTRSKALQGIDYVNNQLEHNETLLPALPWDRFFNWIENQIGIHTLIFISILIINLGVIAFIATWLWPAYEKWLKNPAYTVLVLGIVLLALGGFTDYQARRYTKAIQVVRESNIREKPDSNSGIVSLSYEGYRFKIDRDRSQNYPDWYYVRMGNGQYGWIHRNDLKLF